ncbi:MAG: dihydrofolate reductase [Verrucomicrobiales bacterium]|nr:dihydrofolate reductase [Verrucomicrobiales bacterium]
MPSVVYFVAISLDGFVAAADGSQDWLQEFESGPDVGAGFDEFYTDVDGVIMGRRAYEQVLRANAAVFSGNPVWVYSHSPQSAELKNVRFTAKPPGALLEEMADCGVTRAWLAGGPETAALFQREGLISEYIVTVIPRILGSGIPLFTSQGIQRPLDFSRCRAFTSGLVELTYRAASANP